ncbi:MAG TPA: hypothetical protein VMW36_06115, partial [Patescibacteria group bacterium]|nr:hypothetical protein [Patescibacteria group bacterium]
FAHVQAFFADKPVIVNLMLVSESNEIRVNVNNILAVQRNAVSGLVLSSYTFRKEPVQNRHVNVHGSEFITVEPQVPFIQAILVFVELDKPAVSEGNANMLSTKIKKTRNSDRIL